AAPASRELVRQNAIQDARRGRLTREIEIRALDPPRNRPGVPERARAAGRERAAGGAPAPGSVGPREPRAEEGLYLHQLFRPVAERGGLIALHPLAGIALHVDPQRAVVQHLARG